MLAFLSVMKLFEIIVRTGMYVKLGLARFFCQKQFYCMNGFIWGPINEKNRGSIFSTPEPLFFREVTFHLYDKNQLCCIFSGDGLFVGLG